MPVLAVWNTFEPEDWEAFARAWHARGVPAARPPGKVETLARRLATTLLGRESSVDVGQLVVLMNFTASPWAQWQFVLAAVASAPTDDALGHVAAGPLEHLLGWHGDAMIGRVERQAADDPRFARALTGAWKYRMTDEVWARVQAIQARVPDPLRGG